MTATTPFQLSDAIIYLNHAAVAPWPTSTAEAVCRFAQENALQGAQDYPRWLETEATLRQQVADLVGADSAASIALVKNTSEALSFVAFGLPWQAGDNIVISNEEFPSNRIVWEAVADRFDVELRQVDLHGHDSPEAAVMAACDARTRLVSISSVQYASGLRMDIPVLGKHCRDSDILFCVDAIQSVGALVTDVVAMGADFVMADGHKWLLGPEGLGFFYVRPESLDKLQLNEFGWHMVAHPHDFDRRDWQPAPDARRFECGSPNMLGVHALTASIGVLEEQGMAQVEAAVLARTEHLFDAITASPQLELLSDSRGGRYGGIVTFRHRQQDNAVCQAKLMAAGVVCALRGGGIRFSPHFYTPLTQLDRALELALA